MKMRKGYVATTPKGVRWVGDCPAWAEGCRREGLKVERLMIMSSDRRWCAECRRGAH